MIEYEDTYFFNYETAYLVAKQENKMDNGYRLQICYYDGEYRDSDLVNLVHLPIDHLAENLARGQLRFPTLIEFSDTEFSIEVQNIILESFQENIKIAENLRSKFCQLSFHQAKQLTPNFDEPLRFYLEANVNTQVMQYVSKNIADALEENGYNVLLKFFYGIEDVRSRRDYVEFNPHVTININHLNNHYLNKEVYNFIWFQDPMPTITNENEIILRKKDFIFTLTEGIDYLLKKKNVKNTMSQVIKSNNSIYNTKYVDIIKENKIVFIGNSYEHLTFQNKNEIEITTEITESLNGKKIDLLFLAKKYKIDLNYVTNYLYPAIVRINIIKYIAKNSPIPFEIYGKGWDEIKELKNSYKGSLEYGEEVAKVYNSAKYGLVTNGYYQQRIYEMSLCDAIPVVYSYGYETEKFEYKDSCFIFNKLQELLDIKNFTPKESLQRIKKDASYDDFIEKIITIVES